MVDGAKYNFFSSINGMHQVTEHGTTLVTSSRQGRVFEVDRNGEVVFDFVNVYSAEANEVLHLSNALFLSSDFFQFDKPPECKEILE